MASLQKRMAREPTDARVDDAARLDDWLGLSGYLAEAITAGDVTLEAARGELAAAVTGSAERGALARAAELAVTRLGPESLVASLLHWATIHAGPAAEVA